jgi:hypothetical protein
LKIIIKIALNWSPTQEISNSIDLQLVRKFHSSPSTSSESERLFSAAKLAVGDLRKSLSQERLEKQLYVHHNTLLLGFDQCFHDLEFLVHDLTWPDFGLQNILLTWLDLTWTSSHSHVTDVMTYNDFRKFFFISINNHYTSRFHDEHDKIG